MQKRGYIHFCGEYILYMYAFHITFTNGNAASSLGKAPSRCSSLPTH